MKRSIIINRSVFMTVLISMFSFTNVNSQIIYTDVNPDITTSGTYKLDLNNDGKIDFAITHTSKSFKEKNGYCKGQTATNQYIKVTPLNSNQVLDAGTNARKMAANQTIDANVTSWSSSLNQVMVTYEPTCTYHCWFWYTCGYTMLGTPYGEWNQYAEDGFLGLKLISGGHSYFGWLRMTTSQDSGFTIKDYAFNSKPEQAILAGETSCTAPTIQINADGPLSFCDGDSVILVANGSGYLYQWKKNGEDIPGATYQEYFAKTTGIYKCKVTNSCGSITSNTISVSVYPPMADATITATGPTAVCSGKVMLNANTGTGLSYQWYNGSGIIAGATNSSYAAGTSENYYVIETNNNGCRRQSNSIEVLIGTPTAPTVYSLSGNICNGNPAHLSIDYFQPYYSYQWIKDGVAISGATGSDYYAKEPGTYTLRVSASGGCNSTSAGVLITNDCRPIGYWPFDGNGSDQSGNNRDVTLFGSPVFGTGIFGKALSLDGTGNMYAQRPVDDASFDFGAHDFTISIWVKYNSNLGEQILIEKFTYGGGPGWTLTKLETQRLHFWAEPLFSMTSDPVSIKNGIWHNVIVTRLSNDFKMYFDATLIAEATASGSIPDTDDPLLVGRRDFADGRIFGVNGLLDDAAIWSRALSATEVSLVWNNGIGTPANQFASNAIGVVKPENSIKYGSTGLNRLKLNIAPNPVVSSTGISFSLGKTENVSIKIFDMQGRLISKIAEAVFAAGQHQVSWNAENAKAGIYVLRIDAGNYRETKKLVVAK